MNFIGPQDLVKKGCEALGKCEDMISKLGLFSSNETKDDAFENTATESISFYVFSG